MNHEQLDNPAWSALTTVHADFAIGTARAKRYQPSIVSFAACRNPAGNGIQELVPWITAGEQFFIIGDLPALPGDWEVVLELPCAQMVLTASMPAKSAAAVQIDQLGANDAEEKYRLINMVQPGYFNADTRLMGTYFGIRENGMLVAMAGERMRMSGFSELSAICTHPEHTGRGYAQRLIERLCRLHREQEVTSFLHVALTNERAIRLYEHMGFVQRRVISFHKVRRKN